MRGVAKNTPRLRFPEFSGEWAEKDFHSFLAPDFRAVPKPTQNYLALGVRSHGKGTFHKPNSDPEKNAMDTLYEVHCDDLIVNITFAWEGAIAIAHADDHGGLVSHRFPTYRFDRSQVTSEYFEYVIEDRRIRQTLELISPGGAGRNRVLSKSAFLEIKHLFPQAEEQQKIAAFLGAVDAKIGQLTRKKALLEDYKKGCMGQLFTQKLRFKDDQGNDFPDWEEKQLGEIASFSKGKGISKSDIQPNGKNLCIRYGELYTQYREYIAKVASYTDTPTKRAVLSRKNDVLMPTSDVTPNGLATASAIDIEGVILGGDILIIRSGEILNRFFAYYVAANKPKIMRLVTGVTVYHIYGSDLATLHLGIPHPDEQQKIADFLFAIDAKISLVADELSAAQNFKKGLLQQMFV